jgi:hypothetical protein
MSRTDRSSFRRLLTGWNIRAVDFTGPGKITGPILGKPANSQIQTANAHVRPRAYGPKTLPVRE